MTDNEIIKALECCSGIGKCIECPYIKIDDCAKQNAKDVIDLINQQKAEIDMLKDIIVKNNRDTLSAVAITIEDERERIRLENIRYLEEEIVRLQSMNQAKLDTIHDLSTRLETTRFEAIKEFAEKLKEKMRLDDDCNYDCATCVYECKDYVSIIDKLVKEMTEDEGK